MIKAFIQSVSLVMLLVFCSKLYAAENESETYHILQKGFIKVEGSTNLFRFSGKSIQQQGKLEEVASGLYSGRVLLRFDQISFELPAVQTVLKDPEYLDVESYPTIEITLDHFDPHQQPSMVEGFLKLRDVVQKIRIQVDLVDISPLVKAKGWFSIKQSNFLITPYKSGILEIADELKISFQLYFCEVHDDMPLDHNLNDPQLQSILKEAQITILSEPHFFGCQELQTKAIRQ